MSSQRLNKALAAGKVVVRNKGGVDLSVTLIRLEENPRNPRRPIHRKSIVTLKPGRTVDLTRDYSVKEIRASMQQPKGIANSVNRRPVEVVDTWSEV